MVKEGRSKRDHESVTLLAGEFLKRMCETSAALEMTPHFLVKHAYEIAHAFADECEKDAEALSRS